MSIPSDMYFTVTPATNFKSKAEAQLAGVDYFFFVADNHDLKVKTFNGVISYTLAVGVKWVGVISASDRIHVYYSDQGGVVQHLVFQQFGAGNLTPVATGIGGASSTFSVNFAQHSTPPAFLMLVDTGVSHILYVASDPDFHILLGSKRTFSNLIDQTHFVTRPSIAIHPEDTNVITIHCQQIKVSNSESKVGFYVVKIPGVA